MLGGGSLDYVTILKPATVAVMFTNKIGELDFPARIPTLDPNFSYDMTYGAGMKFGLGLA